MRDYLINHFVQYVIILLVLVTGLIAVFSELGTRPKLMVVIALSALYLIWGIWHHWEDHEEITLATVAEYVLVAVLILWVLLAVS